MIGIYAIRNIRSGRSYVGSSVNIARRWKTHIWSLNHGKHHSEHMQHAWKKYGPEMFAFEILEEVANPDTLLEREQHYLDLRRANGVYNFGTNARPFLGVKRAPYSAETRARMSAAARNRGRNFKVMPRKPRKPMARSVEWRTAIGEANRAAHARPETKERMRQASIARERKRRELGLRKRPDSAETLAKRAASIRAAVVDGRVIVPRFNGPHSEATRQKMKAAWARKRAEREAAIA